MKKAVLLSLIFYGYQFLVSLLFIMLNVIRKEPEPMVLGADALGLSSLISGLLMVGHLIYCRDVTFSRKSFGEVPVRYLLLCLPLVLSAMFFLNVINERLDLPNWGEEAFEMMSRNIWGISAMVFVAPFVEELLFRGAIEGHFLKQGRGSVFAIVVSSLFFAVVHGNPAQMPFAFLIGLLFGWLYYRTGSIVPGVFCHVVNNGLAVLSMLYMPDKELSGWVGSSQSVVFLLTFSLAVFIVSFFYARKHFPKHEFSSSDSNLQ